MKRLYLIGGTMGVGKTTVCQQLKKELPNSVFLDGDWCWDADPFQVTEETKTMVLQNICYLLNSFIHCTVYDMNDAYLPYTYVDVATGLTVNAPNAPAALAPIGATQTDIMRDNVNWANAAPTNQAILMMLNAYRFNQWQEYSMYDVNSTTRTRMPVQTP